MNALVLLTLVVVAGFIWFLLGAPGSGWIPGW